MSLENPGIPTIEVYPNALVINGVVCPVATGSPMMPQIDHSSGYPTVALKLRASSLTLHHRPLKDHEVVEEEQ